MKESKEKEIVKKKKKSNKSQIVDPQITYLGRTN